MLRSENTLRFSDVHHRDCMGGILKMQTGVNYKCVIYFLCLRAETLFHLCLDELTLLAWYSTKKICSAPFCLDTSMFSTWLDFRYTFSPIWVE